MLCSKHSLCKKMFWVLYQNTSFNSNIWYISSKAPFCGVLNVLQHLCECVVAVDSVSVICPVPYFFEFCARVWCFFIETVQEFECFIGVSLISDPFLNSRSSWLAGIRSVGQCVIRAYLCALFFSLTSSWW